jgi:hypothetical protein
MRHQGGPTKKLAPTIDPNISCPHSFTEDEGVQLEVDCLECAGAHDLMNPRCMIGVVNVVSGGVVPEIVILKRFTHKRYRRDAVNLVAMAATELSALNRALAAPDVASDRSCRTCFASRHQVISGMKRRLVENPEAYLLSSRRVAEEIRRAHSISTCERAGMCIDSGIAASTILPGDG